LIDDLEAAHQEAVALGARILGRPTTRASEGFQVYADPAGHRSICVARREARRRTGHE